MSQDSSDLSHDEELALASVLDEIIPRSADGRLPGAGELGLAHRIEETLRQNPALKPVVVQGLSALRDLTRSREQGDESRSFAALSKAERLEALNEVTRSQPAFLPNQETRICL